MRIKVLLGAAALLLLAGCSATNDLTRAGTQVRFVENQPSSDCQLLGQVTGTQSNWLSGVNNDTSALRGAANNLRNKAAEMGGNVIFDASSPSETLLSSFVPVDSKMVGSVYKCP